MLAIPAHGSADRLHVPAAKNVILAGVKSVKLFDPSPVEAKDLGAQFYLSQSDIGQPTAAACKPRLQELNTAVQVAVLDSVTQADIIAVHVRFTLAQALPLS